MKFSELKLDPELLKGIKNAGFRECTPVQEETLQHTLTFKDVCVKSQTGTGKTAAFLISIFNMLKHDNNLKSKQALIIAPTRELAVQIEEDALLIGKYLDFRIGSIYGGVGYAQQEQLIKSGAEIIVGTPGRLIDLGESGTLNFKDFGILVIDEADRLFDMGFLPDIKKILKKMHSKSERKTMLFGATIDFRVHQIAERHMNSPEYIEIEPEQVTIEKITQELYHVGSTEKMKLLLGILKREEAKNVIIFTNTKNNAAELAGRLEINGYACKFITGDLPQKKRLSIINGFKSKKFSILVATDVAARGLHIDDLEIVINYDLPEEVENYVHRIGRTARAGKSGKAISLPCEKYVYSIDAIETYINMKIPVLWAEDELYIEDKSANISYTKIINSQMGIKGSKQSVKAGAKRNSSRKERQPAKSKRIAEPSKKHKKTDKIKSDNTARKTNSQKKKTAQETKLPSRPAKIKKLNDRLNYYKEKYGEDFRLSPEDQQIADSRKKKSILGKIKNLFSKRK